jgi:transposase
LFESAPGATLRGIAADLGVERATLARWVGLYGTGKKTTTDGATVNRPPGGLVAAGAGGGHRT